MSGWLSVWLSVPPTPTLKIIPINPNIANNTYRKIHISLTSDLYIAFSYREQHTQLNIYIVENIE